MPLPNGNLYDNFLIHGCYYRHIDDLTIPWVPSPVVLPRELDDEDEAAVVVKLPYYPSSDTSTSGSSSVGITSPRTQINGSLRGANPANTRMVKKQKRSRLFRFLRRVFRTNFPRSLNATTTIPAQHRQTPTSKRFTGWKGPFPATEPVDIVPLSDWKAWGYYACPFVNKVFVKNHCESHVLVQNLHSESALSAIAPRQHHLYDPQAMFESLRR